MDLRGESRRMNYKNGFFQLEHKEDGTYIRIFPAMQDGKPVTIEDIAAYLHFKKIEEFNIKELNRVVLEAKAPTSFKIQDESIFPENEYLKVVITPDKKQVIGRFYPPSTKGKLVEKEEILSDLAHKGIRHGILEQNIDAYLKSRQFCTNILLAKATEAVPGRDAKITYHFDTNVNSKPKINEDGSVDFHQLDNISHIEKDAVLATLELEDLGKKGCDVMGNPIMPPKVSVKRLKHGRNIHLSEDGTKMYSEVSGHASLVEDKVFVSNTYEVPADVSAVTGDIFYDGNVEVKGNVITGFKIEAKGDIIVHGVVEGATLIAGGQIILKRGIQGMSRGVLKAEGDIVTKFIENSEVYAGGTISTDAIMHSHVSAKGDIIATGKRGLITGGEVKSETMISMKVAGSTMGTKTLMEVGMDPTLAEEYKRLEKQIVDMEAETVKFEQVIGIYAKKISQGEKLTEERMKQFTIAKKSTELLQENIKKAQERCEELRIEMEKHSNGRIKVLSIAYSGVKITIANVSYFVRGEMRRCQFIKEKGEIKSVIV